MAQNVASEDGVLVIVKESLAVVAINSLLIGIFLKPIARILVVLRGLGQPQDELAFNQQRADSLYFIQYLSAVVLPAGVTVLLDENCLRYHALCEHYPTIRCV